MVYNTMSRTKEPLVTMRAGELKMYSCGVTVYDLSHVGHARMMIVFDMIPRYLRFAGYRVTFVRNFTDIEDKIIRRANQEGVSASEVSERYVAAFREAIAALTVLAPEVEPKATEHVPEMIALIERLVAGGYAYVIDGDVYFEVRRFPAYGKLSGKNLDERSEEHTSELQSRLHLVCRLLLEKKKHNVRGARPIGSRRRSKQETSLASPTCSGCTPRDSHILLQDVAIATLSCGYPFGPLLLHS